MATVSLDGVRSEGASVALTAQNAPSTSPPARRVGRKGWKDARLWAGVALVAISVVAGSRIIGALDDTTAVWVPREDIVAGLAVPGDAFEQARITFADPQDAEKYALVADGEPSGHVLREVAAGELVPRSALASAAPEALTSISMELPSAQVPGDVRAGSRVDLWVKPPELATATAGKDDVLPTTRRLARDVIVLEAPVTEVMGAAASTRQVVVGVSSALAEADLTLLVEAAGSSRIVLSGKSTS